MALLFHRSRWLLAGSLFALSLVPASAVASTPRVSVRVEGAHRTLLPAPSVQTSTRQIHKDGGSCAGTSAAGALERATHGHWSGKFFSSFNDYLITTIEGERHGGNPDYWAFWINNTFASQGICSTRLHSGDRLLFLVDNTNHQMLPLGLRTSHLARAGRSFVVSVVRFDSSGRAKAVSGAIVRGPGVRVRTDSKGHARVRFTRAGRFVLKAYKSGLVRSEVEAVRVR